MIQLIFDDDHDDDDSDDDGDERGPQRTIAMRKCGVCNADRKSRAEGGMDATSSKAVALLTGLSGGIRLEGQVRNGTTLQFQKLRRNILYHMELAHVQQYHSCVKMPKYNQKLPTSSYET